MGYWPVILSPTHMQNDPHVYMNSWTMHNGNSLAISREITARNWSVSRASSHPTGFRSDPRSISLHCPESQGLNAYDLLEIWFPYESCWGENVFGVGFNSAPNSGAPNDDAALGHRKCAVFLSLAFSPLNWRVSESDNEEVLACFRAFMSWEAGTNVARHLRKIPHNPGWCLELSIAPRSPDKPEPQKSWAHYGFYAKVGNRKVTFEADEKFYFWNQIDIGICEVLTLRDLGIIMNIVNTRG